MGQGRGLACRAKRCDAMRSERGQMKVSLLPLLRCPLRTSQLRTRMLSDATAIETRHLTRVPIHSFLFLLLLKMAPSTFRTPIPAIETTTPKGLSLRIREATVEDTPTIIALIRALAEYEKEPDAAQATPETIRENIFEKGYGECIIAEVRDGGENADQWKPVGFAVVSTGMYVCLSRVRGLSANQERSHRTPNRRCSFASNCESLNLLGVFLRQHGLIQNPAPLDSRFAPHSQLHLDIETVLVPGRPLCSGISPESQNRLKALQYPRRDCLRPGLCPHRFRSPRLERAVHCILQERSGSTSSTGLDPDAHRAISPRRTLSPRRAVETCQDRRYTLDDIGQCKRPARQGRTDNGKGE